RRIGHDEQLARPAPWKEIGLDAAPREVIEDLIGSHGIAAWYRRQRLHVCKVEITDTPRPDQPMTDQRLESGKRVRDGISAWPVQEIQVELRDAEALQTAFAGCDGAGLWGILRQHLAHDEDLFAAAFDGLSHYPLGFAVAIHLGRVDQRHAEIDAEPERGDLVAPP